MDKPETTSPETTVPETTVPDDVSLDASSTARHDASTSVEAILGDLRHVVGRMPHDDWPEMAKTVLEYHEPPIDEALLGADHIGLQDACRGALAALGDNDYVRAKASIELIRKFEVRLGLELEDIRSDDPA